MSFEGFEHPDENFVLHGRKTPIRFVFKTLKFLTKLSSFQAFSLSQQTILCLAKYTLKCGRYGRVSILIMSHAQP